MEAALSLVSIKASDWLIATQSQPGGGRLGGLRSGNISINVFLPCQRFYPRLIWPLFSL